GTTIINVSGLSMTLSTWVRKPGTGVAIAAGSTTLTSVAVSSGAFVVGTPIEGEGIPAGAVIDAVEEGSLVISEAPSKSGAGVALVSAGPAPLAVGESIEGPGLAPGTTIVGAEAGKLTLSQPALASESEAVLDAGLAFNAEPG